MRRLGLLIPILLAGCGAPEAPRRDCAARVVAEPTQRVVGSWDGWQATWRMSRLALPPGEYGYMVIEHGAEQLDPWQPLTTLVGEREVSLLEVPDCHAPVLDIESVERAGDSIVVTARFLAAAATGAALDPATLSASVRGGGDLDVSWADPSSGRIVLEGDAPAEKASFSINAEDANGRPVSARGAAWATERDARDAIVYQIMIDRFRGDAGAALSPPDNAGARAGGTLDGVASAVDDGYLSALGVDTLWLSPVYTGPDVARAGSDGRLYEGYHGYWPVASRQVDPRIGGEAALESVVERAHAAGMAVLLDLVPNHVYEDNPRVADNPSWFGDACVCGTPACPWADNIERCWFTPYLPDVRWHAKGATATAEQDAVWWARTFDLDGVRIDAVPMMPRATTRRIARALREDAQSYGLVLGEIYTGPGTVAVDQLRYHLGPSGLDAAFDFPLMWALHDAIATGKGSFAGVEAVLEYEEAELEGASFARILDNHDTPRFVSVANGDAGGDPWDAPAAQPIDDAPYRKLMLGLATLFTLPGIVVLYQGDEIGLAGAGDPDNRRVMPDALLPIQEQVRAWTQRLAELRRCSVALRRGTRQPLLVASDRYAYARDDVVVVLNAGIDAASFTLPAGRVAPGTYRDFATGESHNVGAGPIPIDMPPLTARILLPDGDVCL